MDAYYQALKALALAPAFNKPSELDRVEPLAAAGGSTGGRSDGKKSKARKGTGRGSKKSKKNKSKAGCAADASVQTFWMQVEDFFRDVRDMDVQLLAPPRPLPLDPQLAVPLLGCSYHEVWAGEDALRQRSASAVQRRQSAAVAKQKLLSASPVSKAKKHLPAETTAPLVTSVLSPLVDENDEPCDVCFEGDSDELNEIIFCDGCDVAVHQNCYGVATIPRGEDPWFCLRCSAPEPDALSCVLCPLKKGAMKAVAVEEGQPLAMGVDGTPAPSPQHAHLFCAQWVPETYIREGDGAVMNVGGVLKERHKLTCVLCKVKQGVCIQCSHGQCAVAFHPLCARANKLRMEIASREDSEEVELRAFCGKHSKDRPTRVLDLNPPPEPQEGLLAVPAAEQTAAQILSGPPNEVRGETAPSALSTHPQGAFCSGVVVGSSSMATDEAAGLLAEPGAVTPGRRLQLRGGAPDGDASEDEEGVGHGVDSLRGLAHEYAESEEGEDGNDAVAAYGGQDGALEGLAGSGNTFELAILSPEEREYLSPADEAKVDQLLACLDSTVLIELAKAVMAQLNITQTALAHMAAVSQSILSNWLQGRSRPSQEAINSKMRAFLRSYCVATEVPATDGDDEEDPCSYYDVQGYYPAAEYALQANGGYHANGTPDGGEGIGAFEGSSEGSELLHHLAARTAASTGRAFSQHAAVGGVVLNGESSPHGTTPAEKEKEEAEAEEARRVGGHVAQSSDIADSAVHEDGAVGAEAVGAHPDGDAGKGSGARKGVRSQRRRGGGGIGATAGASRGAAEALGSSGHTWCDTAGPPVVATERPESVEQVQPAFVETASAPEAPVSVMLPPPPSAPTAPAVAPPALNADPPPSRAADEPLSVGPPPDPRTNSRVRGAARASALRAAAAAAAAAGATSPGTPAGQPGQKASARGVPEAVPWSGGPEEVRSYTLALAGGEVEGGNGEGDAEGEPDSDAGREAAALCAGLPGSSRKRLLSSGLDDSGLLWQTAQLALARPLLRLAPEDEVVGELYAQQALLLVQLGANASRAQHLLQRLLPGLPAQLRGARQRAEHARLVETYLAAEKDAKKHDRKLRKDKEAAAVLAAATAAAAASPRNTHLRREGSFGGGASVPSSTTPDGAATPGGGGGAQQTELARAAAAGAAAAVAAAGAAVSAAKPPKAPGSGPRSSGQAKMRSRHKAESGTPAAQPPGGPAGRAAGPGAGDRNGRGRAVRPSLPDEWPQAETESGEALCAVCGQGESAPPNQIVFCEQCGVAVHQECYGVRAIPEGPWWCQPCAYHRHHPTAAAAAGPSPPALLGQPPGRGQPGVQCALCPGRTGAMKRATTLGPEQTPLWVHIFCAQWMPGTHPGKGEGALVEGLETLGPDRVACRCSLCGSKRGACLQCSTPRCSHIFHASCARNARLSMTLQSTPDGRLVYHQFCEQHSSHSQGALLSKAVPLAVPDKEAELVQLKIIRVEFERVRMICDRVLRREKLKRERVRTLREVGAVQLALAHQTLAPAAAGGADAKAIAEATAPPKRQRRPKDRDGAGEGLAFKDYSPTGASTPHEGAHGLRHSVQQKKRSAIGEGAREAKRARQSQVAQERQMASHESLHTNRTLPAGYTYVPVGLQDGRPAQGWDDSETMHIQGTRPEYH